jgi:energy-coupling factor transporter ATP-binding protein EcfA2
MAHITEFTLYGLLGRSKPIHLTLQRDVNVLFGENGCGKTTLLKILNAALSMDGAAMAALPVDRAEVAIYSIDEDRIFDLIWERDSTASLNAQLFPNETLLTSSVVGRKNRAAPVPKWEIIGSVPSNIGSGWRHTFLPTTRIYLDDLRTSNGAWNSRDDVDLDEQFARNINQSWLRYYSQVITEVRNVQEDGLSSVLGFALAKNIDETHGPTLDPLVAYQNATSFLSRRSNASMSILGTKEEFVVRYEQEERFRRIIDNLNVVEEQIFELMRPHLIFLNMLGGFFSNGKTVSLVGTEIRICLANGELIPASALSSGEKHLLKLLLSAMRAGSHTIIIDEPELSLHIDWQKKLIETIRLVNPNCQLIVASHSPEIMADVPDEKIYRV